jgi:hypothetical protein|tara:strand:+ start:7054 stop:8109 length:1056 start_codon:yes stop_codon:yes gene_type:complete
MGFEKVEFEFPNEEETSTDIEVEKSSALTMGEVEVEVGESEESEEQVDLAVEAPKEELEYVEDESYEIEVVDDTPENDRDRRTSKPPEAVTDEELKNYSRKVQRRINSFSKSYNDERRLKETALRERTELENFARNLVNENEGLKDTVDRNQEALLEQAKRTAAGEMILAKRAYKAAYEEGDSDKLIEAQEKMTNAKFKADKLDNLGPPPLQQETTPVQTEQRESAPAPIADDRATEWAEANTWFGQDDEMTSFSLGLHTKLVKEGISPQSDDYYEKINSRMRQVFPENFEDASEVEPKPRRQGNNVVAPATRSTAPKKIRLTRTQVNISKRLGITPEQYAQQVAIDMRKQ